MGDILLCAFLILFGLTSLGLGIPMWVSGILAVAAGILKLVGR